MRAWRSLLERLVPPWQDPSLSQIGQGTNSKASTKFKQLKIEVIIDFLYSVGRCLNEQYYLCREKHLYQTQSDNASRDSNRVRVNWRKDLLARFGNRGKPAPTNQNQVWKKNRERQMKYGGEANRWALIGNGGKKKICTQSARWNSPRRCLLV